MRYILLVILILVSFGTSAQAPPMNIGGPQGINVKRILTQDWMSIPVMNDTPNAPLTGSGWPGKGYLIFVTRPDTCIAGNNCPPKDTAIWEYTGARWKRVGFDYLTKLVFGATVTQNGSFARQHIVSSYGAFLNGDYYRQPSAVAVTADPKAADSTSRIDVIVITRAGPVIKKGQARVIPFKPTVAGDEIELSTIYFRSFDTVPRFIASTATGVTNLFRVPGKDSIYFSIDTSTLAIKDSVGITKNDTAAMLLPYLRKIDTFSLSNRINLRVRYSDTASMLNNYKFTAANGLTKDSTVFRLGGSLNQNTNIILNSRRLSIIGGSDTTRFYSDGRLSIGGSPDSAYMFNVNGDAIIKGSLRLQASSPANSAIIINQNSSDGSLVWGASNLAIPSNFAARNVIVSPTGTYSNMTGTENVLLGRFTGGSLTTATKSVFIGNNAGSSITTGSNNTIIGAGDGHNYSSTTTNAIHLIAGGGYESNKGDTVLLGLSGNYALIGGGFGSSNFINDIYLGAGARIRNPSQSHLNLYAPSGIFTDTIGSNFTINAGRGTGAGVGGSIIFRTSPATTSGTTLQTLEERVRISHRGNLLVGTPTDDTSSIVNIVSTAKGFLQPRMTNTQRNAITTPATGLQVFSTTDSANYVYRGTGGGWQKIANEISVSATLDFPSTNNGNKSDLTINSITGAEEGDVVALGITNSVNLNHSCFTAWVSAANTITVRFNNYGTGALDPVSATFKVKVFK